MSIKRINVLLRKEFAQRSKSFFLIFAIVAPIVFTLLVNLVFGTLFSGAPKLGIHDPGGSYISESLENMGSMNVKIYDSDIELMRAVETGTRDAGIVLEENFDAMIQRGQKVKLTTYIWGESLLKNRAMIVSALLYQIRDLSGKRAPVDIVTESLGDEDAVPWKERFLPVIVLMAIFIAGFAVPASSLVDEKEKHTLGALLSTPATLGDIFISKGLMGIIVSVAMGTAILVLNSALNANFGLIAFLLLFGAILACCFGLLIGAFMKDIASLYSAIKGLGIFIYGPGLVSFFPQIPQWIGKCFPTYYVINPLMEITRKGGSWSSIKIDVFILLAITAGFIALVAVTARRIPRQET